MHIYSMYTREVSVCYKLDRIQADENLSKSTDYNLQNARFKGDEKTNIDSIKWVGDVGQWGGMWGVEWDGSAMLKLLPISISWIEWSE